MREVYKASGLYSFGCLGSLSNGAYILLNQFRFPLEYDETKDVMFTADHDRLMSWDYEGFRACLKKHLNTGELAIERWVRSSSHEQVLEFVAEALGYPCSDWTGYRVLGTVHRATGYPVFTLELFKNVSGVPVYTGMGLAPNVEGYEKLESGDRVFGMDNNGNQWFFQVY